MIEKWKIIKGYPDYMVSNIGRVKSLARIVNYSNGSKHPLKSSILKHGYHIQGYPILILFNKKKRNTKVVHRLVAIAFIPNPEYKPCINHKNGIKTDNRAENLEWVTHSENTIHAYKNNLMNPNKGDDHFRSMVTSDEVLAIKQILRYAYIKRREIGSLYGVSRQAISDINSGKNWLSVQL